MFTDKRYGYFSEQAAQILGYSVWRTPEGRDVLVTFVDSRADDIPNVYKWEDAVLVGEVSTKIRDSDLAAAQVKFMEPSIVHTPAFHLMAHSHTPEPIGLLCSPRESVGMRDLKMRMNLNLVALTALAEAYPAEKFPHQELGFISL